MKIGKEKKICFRCKKVIDEDSDYYAISEYDNKNLLRTDYVHKSCWELFLHKLKDVSEAKGLLNRLSKGLTKFGLIEPEKYTI